jgi:hypothetical protein
MLRPEMDWVDSRQRGFISMLDLWVTSSFASFELNLTLTLTLTLMSHGIARVG